MKKFYMFILFAYCMQQVSAQTWNITGNSGTTNANFLGTTDNKDLIFKAKNKERGRIDASGFWRFGSATNYAKIDSAGNLIFIGNGAYLVPGSKYVFRDSSNPNRGLFYNSSVPQYEFRSSSANPTFYINTDNGNGVFAGTLKVGAYTLPSTDGTNGQALTTNGAGAVSWKTISESGSGANTSLSNLTATTAVNASLLPKTDSSLNIGSVSKSWKDIYLDGGLYVNGEKFLAYKAGTGNANTLVGLYALHSNTSGADNTAVGYYSMYSNTTGGVNTAIGYKTLYTNLGGSFNTAVGYDALYSNADGSFNTAVGRSSLMKNTSGYDNSAFGEGAMSKNTTGYSNVAIGKNALESNKYGSYNTAIGDEAMAMAKSPVDNTAVGYQALYNNSTNFFGGNTAIGRQALFTDKGGIENVAIGSYSLHDNIGDWSVFGGAPGCYNTAVGNATLTANRYGAANTALGKSAGKSVIDGSDNTFLGYSADCGDLGSLNNATAIGAHAFITESNHFVFGDSVVNGWGFATEAGTRAIKVGNSSSNGNGAYLTRGGVWTSTSARSKKENFQKQDGIAILVKINKLEITKWKYKGTDSEYHYGPMADDFHRLFAVGDDSSVSDMDKTGILFLGMQALGKENEKLKTANTDLKKEVDDLKNLMLQMQQQLQQLQQCTLCGGAANAIQQNNIILADAASLEQNIPNPFTNTTTIGYSLPAKFSSAKIIITDKNGRQLKQLNLSGAGKGTVHVDASTLASGAYNYSLYVDGRLIATKQMELLK